MSKGDDQRPASVSAEEFLRKWDLAFPVGVSEETADALPGDGAAEEPQTELEEVAGRRSE
tara:strand:+ start:1063 stop:1242 length:180 start_codon:yes stop_codon:yes gene_type:complete